MGGTLYNCADDNCLIHLRRTEKHRGTSCNSLRPLFDAISLEDGLNIQHMFVIECMDRTMMSSAALQVLKERVPKKAQILHFSDVDISFYCKSVEILCKMRPPGTVLCGYSFAALLHTIWTKCLFVEIKLSVVTKSPLSPGLNLHLMKLSQFSSHEICK